MSQFGKDRFFGKRMEYIVVNESIKLDYGNGRYVDAVLQSHGSSDAARDNRKSMEITQNIKHGNYETTKKFLLLAFPEDHYYINDFMGRQLMYEFGLQNNSHKYVVVSFNNEPFTLYLFSATALNTAKELEPNQVVLLRSKKDGLFEVKWSASSYFRYQAEKYIRRLSEAIKKGEELSSFFKIEPYLKWIALNTILKNCDSTDELFLGMIGVNSAQGLFGNQFVSWDHEEIFCQKNQPEYFISNAEYPIIAHIQNSSLNRYLLKNPTYYKKYVSILKEILDILTDTKIENLIELTRRSIFTDEILLNPTALRDVSKQDIEDQFRSLIHRLKSRRDELKIRILKYEESN